MDGACWTICLVCLSDVEGGIGFLALVLAVLTNWIPALLCP